MDNYRYYLDIILARGKINIA